MSSSEPNFALPLNGESAVQGECRTSSESTDFSTRWKNDIAIIDVEIRKYLDRLTLESPVRLKNAIEYSLMAPGKRLRPLLAMWGSEAICGHCRPGLPAAVAVEMIHCYSLIHDDLPAMDDDDLRRGRPTCHIQFDEATAILAGDALQPMAFEVLATGYDNPYVIARACRFLPKLRGPPIWLEAKQTTCEPRKKEGMEPC